VLSFAFALAYHLPLAAANVGVKQKYLHLQLSAFCFRKKSSKVAENV
jgi:hypothetical protein